MNRISAGSFHLGIAVVATTCFLTAAAARAHDLWIEKRGNGWVLLYGHAGHGRGEPETVEYDPSDVLMTICVDSSGTKAEAVIGEEHPLRIEGGFAAVYVLTSSGYWSETPFGLKNLPKDEAKAPIKSWISLESVKRIDFWGDAVFSPLTDDLEITPVKNPLTLSEGDKARLLVTVGGKPAAGVPVAYDDSTRGVTDSKGRINIRLVHGGLQMIKASLREPGDGIKADEVVHTTTLLFDIAEK